MLAGNTILTPLPLLHNGVFCNGCITKRILLCFHKKTNIMQIMTKNITIFIFLIFYHREIVKLDHFMTLSLSYANTVLLRSRCKIHRFLAAPPFPLRCVCSLFSKSSVYSIVAEEYYQLREPVINLPQHKAIHRTRVRAFQFHARGRERKIGQEL